MSKKKKDALKEFKKKYSNKNKKDVKKKDKSSKKENNLLTTSLNLIKTNIEIKSLTKKNNKEFLFYKEGKFKSVEIDKHFKIMLEIPSNYTVLVNNEAVDKSKATSTEDGKVVETIIRYCHNRIRLIR